ncbi:phage tail protein I [Silvimonas sp.]|uniref:phage tail protein I n=1 Tax=Silvimonas sp. TaxID=2650811 RepID=UPI002845ED9A|nr:phage tail protein I [Silvimonas sp.]MDR3429017.1 phage tail protein I [Silvimonas sp.]
MTDPCLLPPSSTQLERNVAAACAPLAAVPVPQRTLWLIDSCPSALLPHLAWTFSVDRWDADWPEATKRAVIKSAAFVHQRKGTIGAIRRVVEPLGYLIRMLEWWETNPPGQRGTFQLEVGVLDTGITEEMYVELERLIEDAKRKSQHLTRLAVVLESHGSVSIGISAYQGDELTVYPWQPESISVGGTGLIGGAIHTIDTMSIYP